MKKRIFRIMSLVVFLSGGITWAQVTTGTISGTVKDGSGAVLPGTKVTVLNDDTGISRTVESDTEGRYSAPSLSLGTYRVTGVRDGFQTEVRSGIVLTVGREAIVDLSLTVGAVTQTVEVTGEAPLVEATAASLGSLVDDQTIRTLPLNGRSYDQLALLQPGVIATSPGVTVGSSFLFGSGKRFSVGGQRTISNSFLLDGTDINDQGNGTPGGAAGNNLGVDTILEFKIFTNAFKAEYGHSTGSVTSAVTRSGTNIFHGTGFEYIRNSVLDTKNFFDVGSSPPPFKRNQFGGVLGGPIKKDKTFIFGGYEGLRQGQDTTQIATVPTLLTREGILPDATIAVSPAIAPYLNLYPLPNGRDFGDGTAQFLYSPTTITNEDNFMVRVDHQLNAKTSIFGRYSFDNDSLTAPQLLPDQVEFLAGRRQYTTLQVNNILGPKALNNFRFAFNRTHSISTQNTIPDPGSQLAFIPGQPVGTLNVGGLDTAGSRAITPFGSTNGQGAFVWAFNVFEWGDDFTYVTGKHAIKVGVDIQRIQDNTVQSNQVRGTYTFSTLNNFIAGKASNLQASSPIGTPNNWGVRQTLYAAYAQDDYALNSRITMNLGLRWEVTTDPYDINRRSSTISSPSATALTPSNTFFAITKLNFEPRFGLAWRLNASGKTVLRAGGGIYHDQILPWAYQQQIAEPPFFGTFSLSNPPFPNGSQLLKPGTTPIALKVMAPFQKTPVDDQYNLSIQQEIFKNTVVQVAYAGNIGNHLQMVEEADTATPTFCSSSLNNCPAGLANGDVFYPLNSPRLNPAFAGMKYYQTAGDSNYNSLTVTLRRQLSSGFQGQIFYTYSKSLDEGSNTNTADSVRSPTLILDPFDPRRDWGPSEFDSKHALVFNFSYQLPFRPNSRALEAIAGGWTLDGIGTFSAGMPFTARLATSVSRDLSSSLSERPNLKPGFSSSPTQGVSAGCTGFPAGTQLGIATSYYDPCAFSLPAAGTYGNLGRDTIIGPGIADVDLALEKMFKLYEKVNVTFRTEMFNIMNHANFGLPNTTALASTGAANSAAGVITYTTTSSRQLQFGLRINF